MKFDIRLSGDAIVSTVVTVEAKSAAEAKIKALQVPEHMLEWSVDSLHEEPHVHECKPH